jgi:hypothetical protein
VIVAKGPPSWIASGLAFALPGLNPLMREFKTEWPVVSYQLPVSPNRSHEQLKTDN